MRTFTVSASSPNFKIFVNEYHAGPNNDIPMMSAITTNKNEKFGARGYEYYIRYEGLSEYAKATGSIK